MDQCHGLSPLVARPAAAAASADTQTPGDGVTTAGRSRGALVCAAPERRAPRKDGEKWYLQP